MTRARWSACLMLLATALFPGEYENRPAPAMVQAAETVRAADPVESPEGVPRRAPEPGPGSDAEYARALDLCSDHRYFEALPLLESLAERYPSDPVVLRQLGYSLIMTSVEPQDAEDRKRQRARARRTLLAAKASGAGGELLEYYLGTIPEDGGMDTLFSNRREVNDAMREGEMAFARRDYKGAIAAYTRAMEADPGLYPAVLFIGDSHFAGGEYASAGVWFERATRIDPNQEIAFRYWGDALIHLGRMDEARLRFIDAIIAEPYNRRSWVGLVQWANANKVKIVVPDIQKPGSSNTSRQNRGDDPVRTSEGPKTATVDGTGNWALVPTISSAWKAETFKRHFPEAKDYRHTLMEELEALEAVAKSVRQDMEAGALKRENLAPGLSTLLALQDAGMLEPFILLQLPDSGIAVDYAPYRKEKRETLKRYLDAYVAPRLPVSSSPAAP